MNEAHSPFEVSEEVLVETKYFGICRARVVGYYPRATPPYVNLWLLSGYPNAFYTVAPEKVYKRETTL